MITLSEPLQDRQTIIDHVEARGRGRIAMQKRGGRDMSDADFLTGALAAMEAIGITSDQWPPDWIFGLMTDDSPLRRKLPTPESAHA